MLCIFLLGLTSKSIPPSKTDCFLQRNFRLTNLACPGYHLRSKQLLVFRSNCKTWVPNISFEKKSWFKLCYQNWPMKLPKTRSWHTRTWCPDVYWSLLCRGPTGSSMMIRICIINNVLHNLSRKQSWKQNASIIFPFFIVTCVSQPDPQIKWNAGLQSFQLILRCWQSTCFSGFWGSYLGIAGPIHLFVSYPQVASPKARQILVGDNLGGKLQKV